MVSRGLGAEKDRRRTENSISGVVGEASRDGGSGSEVCRRWRRCQILHVQPIVAHLALELTLLLRRKAGDGDGILVDRSADGASVSVANRKVVASVGPSGRSGSVVSAVTVGDRAVGNPCEWSRRVSKRFMYTQKSLGRRTEVGGSL